MADSDVLYRKTVGKGKERPVLMGLSSTNVIDLVVVDIDYGYVVMLMAEKRHFLKWFDEMDEAVEYGVKKAQEFIENGIPILKEETHD